MKDNSRLCVVLTYKNNGSKKVRGQTVGTDGYGDHAVVFYSDSEEKADASARRYAKALAEASEYEGHISELRVVGYGDSPIVRINDNVPESMKMGCITQHCGSEAMEDSNYCKPCLDKILH